jgi:hypothetical protein
MAENQTTLKKLPLKKMHYNLRYKMKTCKHKKYEPLKAKRVEASTIVQPHSNKKTETTKPEKK